MRVIHEQDIENTDFIEIHLSDVEIEFLKIAPYVQEFKFGDKILNISIQQQEEDYAIS
jgi:hypothetical protein